MLGPSGAFIVEPMNCKTIKYIWVLLTLFYWLLTMSNEDKSNLWVNIVLLCQMDKIWCIWWNPIQESLPLFPFSNLGLISSSSKDSKGPEKNGDGACRKGKLWNRIRSVAKTLILTRSVSALRTLLIALKRIRTGPPSSVWFMGLVELDLGSNRDSNTFSL